jgi:hypothetical protein
LFFLFSCLNSVICSRMKLNYFLHSIISFSSNKFLKSCPFILSVNSWRNSLIPLSSMVFFWVWSCCLLVNYWRNSNISFSSILFFWVCSCSLSLKDVIFSFKLVRVTFSILLNSKRSQSNLILRISGDIETILNYLASKALLISSKSKCRLGRISIS